jgi:hypothetical protein
MLLKYILDYLNVSAPQGSEALTNYAFCFFILSLASPCITSFYKCIMVFSKSSSSSKIWYH